MIYSQVALYSKLYLWLVYLMYGGMIDKLVTLNLQP